MLQANSILAACHGGGPSWLASRPPARPRGRYRTPRRREEDGPNCFGRKGDAGRRDRRRRAHRTAPANRTGAMPWLLGGAAPPIGESWAVAVDLMVGGASGGGMGEDGSGRLGGDEVPELGRTRRPRRVHRRGERRRRRCYAGLSAKVGRLSGPVQRAGSEMPKNTGTCSE
jgi:hypothetical protein